MKIMPYEKQVFVSVRFVVILKLNKSSSLACNYTRYVERTIDFILTNMCLLFPYSDDANSAKR